MQFLNFSIHMVQELQLQNGLGTTNINFLSLATKLTGLNALLASECVMFIMDWNLEFLQWIIILAVY